MADFQYLPRVAQPGAPVQGGINAIPFRSGLDARRSMQNNRTPSAEWPDGYLGTIQSRREDRLLDSVKNRVNQKSYQRGVHKGERIDPSDYFWPEQFQPTDGLAQQARGLRYSSRIYSGRPTRLVNDGKAPVGVIDPTRQDYLRSMRPKWV